MSTNTRINLANPAKHVPSMPALPKSGINETGDRESRKVRYTKLVIREAFIQLMQDQPIEKVTVTCICELADISRGTFYLHYRDAYDLLESMENELLLNLERRFTETMGHSTPDNPASSMVDYSIDPDFWLGILKWLHEDKSLSKLFFANPHSSFMTKCLSLNRSFSDKLCRGVYPNLSESEREYMHTYYEHGSASIMSLWVQNGFVEPPETIAGLLALLNSKQEEVA